MKDTKQQFEHVDCNLSGFVREERYTIMVAAWDVVMRPSSVTDQIFIKANRIRSIEIKGVTLVNEGIRPEFIAIVNYRQSLGLIQLEQGYAETDDIDRATGT